MITNKNVLIFPPGWSPTSPYLALPQLKGYLEQEGLKVDIVDENVIFFDTILSIDFLKLRYEKIVNDFNVLNEKSKLSEHELLLYKKILKILPFEKEIEEIEYYKTCLRTNVSYMEKNKYITAINIIMKALEVLNIYYNMSISFYDIKFKDFEKFNHFEKCITYISENENIIKDYFAINKSLFTYIKQRDYIGISITSKAQLIFGIAIAKFLRNNIKSTAKIFFGGNYISRFAQHKKQLLPILFDEIDFIVINDGETTLKELFSGEEYEKINNILYCRNGLVIENKTEINELKYLPVPNFSGFDLRKYLNPEIVFPLFTSKNCYSNCAFCNISNTNKSYITYNLEDVIINILELQNKYNANYFYFVDQTFAIKRMIQFAKILLEKNIKIFWACESRFDYSFREWEVALLKKSGCLKIQFGLESYNQRVLDLMNKRIYINNINSNIELLVKENLPFHIFSIIGFPSETIEEILNTINYIKTIKDRVKNIYEMRNSSFGFSLFMLEHGSPVSKNPNEFSIEINDNNYYNNSLLLDYSDKTGISKNEVEDIFLKFYDRNFNIDNIIYDELQLFFIGKKLNKINVINSNKNDLFEIQINHDINDNVNIQQTYFYDKRQLYYFIYNPSSDFSINSLLMTYNYIDNKLTYNDETTIVRNSYIFFYKMDEKITYKDNITGIVGKIDIFTYNLLVCFSNKKIAIIKKNFKNILEEKKIEQYLRMFYDNKMILFV